MTRRKRNKRLYIGMLLLVGLWGWLCGTVWGWWGFPIGVLSGILVGRFVGPRMWHESPGSGEVSDNR